MKTTFIAFVQKKSRISAARRGGACDGRGREGREGTSFQARRELSPPLGGEGREKQPGGGQNKNRTGRRGKEKVSRKEGQVGREPNSQICKREKNTYVNEREG